jgi:hypothetical protein
MGCVMNDNQAQRQIQLDELEIQVLPAPDTKLSAGWVFLFSLVSWLVIILTAYAVFFRD